MKPLQRQVQLLFLAGLALAMAFAVPRALAADTGGTITLRNDAVQVVIEQRGGAILDFQRRETPLNPLSWRSTPEKMPKLAAKDALYKGHFLCMGRIGAPSPGEIQAGVPMRGEQTGRVWDVVKSDPASVVMECEAPLDALKVNRRVDLTDDGFVVTEQFENTGSLGRFHNVLQHATLGPPFLSGLTLINTNAKQGFNHKFERPDPQKFENTFPTLRLDQPGKRTTDLRLSSDPVNYLSRHVFSPADTYGWATAYDPTSGLVLGYVWKTRDYPWLNIWQQVKEGQPVAKALEFGTAGREGTYLELLEQDTRFHGVPSWEFLDAGEKTAKSYLAFLVNIGPNQENPFLEIANERFLLNGRLEIENPFHAGR